MTGESVPAWLVVRGRSLFDELLDRYDDWLKHAPYFEPDENDTLPPVGENEAELVNRVRPTVRKLCVRLCANGHASLAPTLNRAFHLLALVARELDGYCGTAEFNTIYVKGVDHKGEGGIPIPITVMDWCLANPGKRPPCRPLKEGWPEYAPLGEFYDLVGEIAEAIGGVGKPASTTPPAAGEHASNPDLIRQEEAAFKYDIPKTTLCRLARETRAGMPRLTAYRDGRRVYLVREEVRRLQARRARAQGRRK